MNLSAALRQSKYMEQKTVSNVPEPGDEPILHEPDAVFISDGPGTGSGSGFGVRPVNGGAQCGWLILVVNQVLD